MRKYATVLLLVLFQPVHAQTELDLLVLYTPDVLEHYSSRAGVLDRVAYLIDSNNGYYAASAVNIRLHAVAVLPVDYDPDHQVKDATALKDLTSGKGQGLAAASSLRDYYGADLVMLVRMDDGSNVCGQAWNNRVINTWIKQPKPIESDRDNGYLLIHADCTADALGHELGHNLGLAHDRLNSARGATYKWSTGHGVDGQFATLMTFGSVWSNAVELNVYSDPQKTCFRADNETAKHPCGVDVNDPQHGADSVTTLNTTAPVVGDWSPTNGLIPALNAVQLLR